VLVLLFALIQAVPYGRSHGNPSVRQEPAWDSPATRALAADACFDCHSNQTSWPWYSHIAPISWLIQRDVDNGREALNFSEWDREQEGADEAAEKVGEKEMPPAWYGWLHPKARLSSAERQALVQGLQAMFGSGGGEEGD
jgi:mono/diheme cytochrome c family protein